MLLKVRHVCAVRLWQKDEAYVNGRGGCLWERDLEAVGNVPQHVVMPVVRLLVVTESPL